MSAFSLNTLNKVDAASECAGVSVAKTPESSVSHKGQELIPAVQRL